LDNNIGKNIKKYRIEKKFSREELAKELKISIHTLAKYEQGQRHPSIDVVKKIAEVLDIAVVKIIGGFGSFVKSEEGQKLLRDARGLSAGEFLQSKSESILEDRRDIVNPIKEIAKLANIRLEETFSPEVLVESIYAGENEPPITRYEGGLFNGINIYYKDKVLNLTEEEYYKLANRIIDSIAVNIIAAKDY